MRRTITLLLTACLVVGAFGAPAADAGKKKYARKAKAVYDSPALGAAGAGFCSGSNGCATFPVTSGEKFVQLKIVDQLGQAVYASASQDLDGDNFGDVGFQFCGATDGKQPIEPGHELLIFIWEGPGANPPCPGLSSSGTVKATFTK